MPGYRRVPGVIAAVAAASLAIGCGDHSTGTPAAPSVTTSASGAPTTGATTGATIAGTVVGSTTSGTLRTLGVGLTVSASGSAASTTVDGGGHFVLQNVPAGHVDLHFTGAGVDGHVGLDSVAEHASVTIAVRVSGSTVELDDEQSGANNETEIEGLVTSTSAATITVNGKMITVNASTIIVHGDTTLTLASIKVGDRVHVKGAATTTAGVATILATTIEVQSLATPPVTPAPPTPPTSPPGDDGGGDGKNEAEASGAIAGKTGTCPALSFTVGSKQVTTNAGTQFKDVTCAALANGTKVAVNGTTQASGAILATRVERDE